MKLGNFVSFGRPQSGKVIIQVMAELDVLITKYWNSNTKPSRKQSNALIFSTKNRMSQCTYFENI